MACSWLLCQENCNILPDFFTIYFSIFYKVLTMYESPYNSIAENSTNANGQLIRLYLHTHQVKMYNMSYYLNRWVVLKK